MKLPSRPLSRRAVKKCFDRIPAGRWEYWFRHEKKNGIFELRVPGPFDRAYYHPQAIKQWVVAEGYYHPLDFEFETLAMNWCTPLQKEGVEETATVLASNSDDV